MQFHFVIQYPVIIITESVSSLAKNYNKRQFTEKVSQCCNVGYGSSV